MIMKKSTHTGVIHGKYARTPKGYTKAVNLRETKRYWITEGGSKYHKEYGGTGVGKWPHYDLDLSSITPI